MKKIRSGFTLIELLIVIAVIAILAAAVFIALNPAQRFQQARNSRRSSDLTNLMAAIKTDQVDNGGSYVSAITSLTADQYYTVGTDAAGCNTGCTAKTTQAACANLTPLVTEGYLGSIPFDPSTGSAANTDYYISRRANGSIEVGACDAEGGTTISFTQ